MHNLKEKQLEPTSSGLILNCQENMNSENCISDPSYALSKNRTAKSILNKFKLLSLAFIFLAIVTEAQTPQTPIINYATQRFPKIVTNASDNNYRLVISQNISPRVFRAAHPSTAEGARIMFIGHWLDITDEVVITGPGVNSPRGVTVLGLSVGNKQITTDIDYQAIHTYYNGPYAIVNFSIASDATVGTHTVRLRRPRFGVGKDETVFYIEVYDAVRIHTIRFSKGGDTGQLNTSGIVTIKGDNLDRITSIGDCGGMLSNVSNFQKTNKQITFNATLIRKGRLDYNKLMSTVAPANLKNIEYPTQLSVTSQQRHWLIIE